MCRCCTTSIARHGRIAASSKSPSLHSGAVSHLATPYPLGVPTADTKAHAADSLGQSAAASLWDSWPLVGNYRQYIRPCSSRCVQAIPCIRNRWCQCFRGRGGSQKRHAKFGPSNSLIETDFHITAQTCDGSSGQK